MTKPSDKQRLIDWFYRTTFPNGVLQFDAYLLEAVTSALGKSVPDAQAYIETNRTRVWNWVSEQNDADTKDGLHPVFVQKDSNSRRFAWYAHELEMSCHSKFKRRSAQLKSRPLILQKIDSMTARDFEILRCVACRLIGAQDVELTPRGDEGGIDFFGLVAFPGKTHFFGGSTARIRLIGQSKKYETKVSVDKIRDFMTTVEQVKHRSRDLKYPVPDWFYSHRGPILGWMISHKGFQSGAITLARSHGIILSRSTDISEIMALSRLLAQDKQPQVRADELELLIRLERKRYQN